MTKCLICSCNKTMPLLEKDLGQPIHQALCRHEVGNYLNALDMSEDLLVACTQERPLFSALAESKEKIAATSIKFVNIRETALWSSQADQALPKARALMALASMPEADPVPSVTYLSRGRLLIVGPASRVAKVCDLVKYFESLKPSVLVTSDDGPFALLPRDLPVLAGQLVSLKGYLGAFVIRWRQTNPIDLDVCTRCGACLQACPENAITENFQINLDHCKAHRQCVSACDAVGAIRFDLTDRSESTREEVFDLVLDLSDEPAFAQADPPRGFRHTAGDEVEAYKALADLSGQVGEFDKPKFFNYDARLCAHGRNGQVGCRLCLDTCSTSAIRSEFLDGRGRVDVNPNLCMGCGACSTVCPSGAMRFSYPSADRIAEELRLVLRTYEQAGGKSPSILFFGQTEEFGDGRALIEDLGRQAQRGRASGLPANVIPMGQHHVASVGIEVWLASLCYGASEVLVMVTGREASEYLTILNNQVDIARAILTVLGLPADSIALIRAEDAMALDSQLVDRPKKPPLVALAAAFTLGRDKRTALESCLEYFGRHATPSITPAELPAALPVGSPLGGLTLDEQKCTLCMSCVGACPEGALKDGGDRPILAFIERNCVQCGLCVRTCPESALSLDPRLAPLSDRREALTIHEAEPLCCLRCGRPFGTQQALRAMIARIGSHPAFQGDAARRLEMCSDCRVVDMVEKEL
jgi:ferredoxin